MGYQSKQKRRRKRRRHDEDFVPSSPTVIRDPADEVRNAFKNPALMKNPDTIIAMQSVLGNQAVQRVLSEAESAPESANEHEAQRQRERIEQYTIATTQLEQAFPSQNLPSMLEMLTHIGYKPDESGTLVDIVTGKQPEYLPTNPDSVYALTDADSEATGKPLFFSDDVHNQMVRLEIIMSLFFPKDHAMQAALENPVVTVTGMDGNLLGVTGLGNSAQLSEQMDVKAHINEYAPLARLIPLEHARKLSELNPEIFRILLQDMMPASELDEIISALQNFLNHLRNMVAKEELLRTSQWNEAKLRGMLDKDSSSFDQVIATLNAMPR